MPIIKSAKKKMRQDKKRTAHNKVIKDTLKGLLKKARTAPSPESLSSLASALDKAVKTKLIHPNKAARLKSRLSKAAPAATTSVATKKAAPKKTAKSVKKTKTA